MIDKDKIENLSDLEIIILLKSISKGKSFYNNLLNHDSIYRFQIGDSELERPGDAWLYDGKHFIKILQYSPGVPKEIYKNYPWVWVNSVGKFEREYIPFIEDYNNLESLKESFDISNLSKLTRRRINLDRIIQ